jgi:hypothetical protein
MASVDGAPTASDPAGLALVIIGRNPGTDLERLLNAALTYGFADLLFVDSGSTDGSDRLAASRGVRTIVLPPSAPGAAAARAAGTLAVNSEWILYLDSDMVPVLSALRHIHSLLAGLPVTVAGVTALTRDRFAKNGSRIRHAHERSGDRASYFGGAVILRRIAVLEAGNWNPLVVANEELDLHARIRASQRHLRFERCVLVDHWTTRQGVLDKLAFLVNWRGRAGARFGAPGLALRSCLDRGAARHLFLLSPEPFVATPGTLLAIGVGVAGQPFVGLAMLLALWAWIWWRRGLPYLAPSYLLFPQIFVGMSRYGGRR